MVLGHNEMFTFFFQVQQQSWAVYLVHIFSYRPYITGVNPLIDHLKWQQWVKTLNHLDGLFVWAPIRKRPRWPILCLMELYLFFLAGFKTRPRSNKTWQSSKMVNLFVFCPFSQLVCVMMQHLFCINPAFSNGEIQLSCCERDHYWEICLAANANVSPHISLLMGVQLAKD